MNFVNLSSQNYKNLRRQRPESVSPPPSQRPRLEEPNIIEISDSDTENVNVNNDNESIISLESYNSADNNLNENIFEDPVVENDINDRQQNGAQRQLSEEPAAGDNEIDSDFDDDVSEVEDIPADLWAPRATVAMTDIFQFATIFKDDEACERYLINTGVFYGPNNAPKCHPRSTTSMNYRNGFWKCNGLIIDHETGDKCCNGRTLSVRTDSFFACRRAGLHRIMCILYLWGLKLKRTQIAALAGVSRGVVQSVLNSWYQMIQEDLRSEDVKIGGPGVVVEIDESKFGKRKYNRGHRVDGVWVVGGVERTTERRCFLIVVNNRNRQTLRQIISNHVLPGSIVYTDCWAGYNGIQELGLQRHRTVNHSNGFVEGEACTNSIEGTWNGVKITVPARLRNRKMMPWVLVEFIWRRKYHGDIFGAILRVLSEVSFSANTINVARFTDFDNNESIESNFDNSNE